MVNVANRGEPSIRHVDRPGVSLYETPIHLFDICRYFGEVATLKCERDKAFHSLN
jgi:hypothetical protein